MNDLRYAFRSLRTNPGVTAVVVLTLGLGIGANTAIFSVVNGVLFRPLDFPNPDRLYTVWENREARNGPPDEWTGRSTFADWRSLNRSLEGLAAVGGWVPNLTGLDRPESLQGERVSPGYFGVLGLQPILGRTFLPEEELPGNDRVVVLSGEFWRRRLGGDPGVVGRTLTLNGEPFTIVGVLPTGFRAPFRPDLADVWAPLRIDPAQNDRGNNYLRVVARLAPGVSESAARDDMSRVAAHIAEAYPADYRDVGVTLVPLRRFLVGPARTPLLILLGAVGLVLVIACANIASVLIARLTSRERELAVRTALGATRERLVQQLLTESLLLALAGGLLGLLVGSWGMELLRRFAPPGTPRLEAIQMDPTVLAFTLLTALATGIAFGLLPAWTLSRVSPADRLREGARGVMGSGGRLRRVLVVGELGLGLTLLVGAGLLVRSFAALTRVDPGFRSENVLSTLILLPASRYAEPHQVSQFWSEMEARTEAQPGVGSAGAVSALPFSGVEIDLYFLSQGMEVPEGRAPSAAHRVVTPRYFETLHIPLIRGRVFDRGDHVDAPGVVVINEEMARRFFANADPIGRRLQIGGVGGNAPWWTIVGIVGNVHHTALDQPPEPEMYRAHAQVPNRAMYLVARSGGDPETLIPVAQQVVWSLDPELPLARVAALKELVGRSLAGTRFITWMLGGFALLALLLAAIGTYGLLAYMVGRRTRELGVRMALGARTGDVLRLVLQEGARLIAAGLALGLVTSLVLSRALRGLLFAVEATDPLTIVAAAFLLGSAALAACYLPARRAAHTDPMEALRYE